jgi:hypothetical protein
MKEELKEYKLKIKETYGEHKTKIKEIDAEYKIKLKYMEEKLITIEEKHCKALK